MTENAQMLDETAYRLFARVVEAEGRTGPKARDACLRAWDEAELSFALTPERDGGLGATLSEAAVIAWRAGYHGAPMAVSERLMLGMLSPAMAGDAPATLANGRGVLAERSGDRWQLSGSDLRAPFAGADTLWAVPVSGEGGPGIAVVAVAEPAEETTMSGDLWLRAACDAVQVRAVQPLDPIVFVKLPAAGALLTTTVIAGALRFMLETGLEHVTTRKQFGRPLAKFQAVQHQLADAAAERVLTEAVLGEALRRFDAGVEDAIHWRVAKLQAARAARVVAMAVHQTTGAVGYTREHALHCYTGRIWDLRDQWGRQADLERDIGRSAAQAGAELWSFVVGAGGRHA